MFYKSIPINKASEEDLKNAITILPHKSINLSEEELKTALTVLPLIDPKCSILVPVSDLDISQFLNDVDSFGVVFCREDVYLAVQSAYDRGDIDLEPGKWTDEMLNEVWELVKNHEESMSDCSDGNNIITDEVISFCDEYRS
jgi:hypothetical protein